MSSPWKRRKPRLGDAVSSSLRMLSWDLRMVHFGVTPEGKEISGLIYHLSAKCLAICGLKEATPALRVGLEVLVLSLRTCFVNQGLISS